MAGVVEVAKAVGTAVADAGKSAYDMFQLPGNGKQSMLPFLLDPSNRINDHVPKSSDLKGIKASPQVFSFKSNAVAAESPDGKTSSEFIKGNSATICVCPSSFYRADFKKLFKKDASFKSLFAKEGADITENKIGIGRFLMNMPSVQIREYTPDVRLTQFFNFMKMLIGMTKKVGGSLMDGLVSGFQQQTEKDAKKGTSAFTGFFKSVGMGLWEGTMSGLKEIGGFVDWFKSPEAFKGAPVPAWAAARVKSEQDLGHILNTPFILYYLLQSQVTTNIYELPFIPEKAFDLAGQNGWKTGQASPYNDFLGKLIGKIPGIGNMINSAFSNVAINYMTSWDSQPGTDGPYPQVTAKFSLFNDSVGAAVANFIFVNTIAPNNMWMQYGLLQQSPSVYDVKIAGQARMYMCKGNVKVSNKGVYRAVSKRMLKILAGKHLN